MCVCTKQQRLFRHSSKIIIQVLVCSDQMARGMDVEGVSCVVNYDPPRQYQTYLHRAGRTARAGQKGVVFTLLSREEVSDVHVPCNVIYIYKKKALYKSILTENTNEYGYFIYTECDYIRVDKCTNFNP